MDKKTLVPKQITQREIDIDIFNTIPGKHVPVTWKNINLISTKMTQLSMHINDLQLELLKLQKEFDNLFL